ncbi:MAG: TatD family hydrolase [Lachnospirales bacterium]
MIFDTHAHYDDDKFNDDRYTLIEEMHQNGVCNIINIGCDIKSSKESIDLAKKYDFIYAAVGVHPTECGKMCDKDLEILADYAKYTKVVAIGEIGLDYYWDNVDKQTQKLWFRKQLDLAYKLDLPVVIHSRDATQDTYDIIKESKVRKGVIHAFSGSKEFAKLYTDMGFYIGVGGVVTYKNAKKLVEAVEITDLDRILLETDSPYLSPTPFRGTRNNSQNIKYVADKIGEIKQISAEIVLEKCRENANVLFCNKKVVA